MLMSLLQNRLRRRGVILVVILGMLGLMALIGVTFASFSGQARINARNFLQGQNQPWAADLMDFALSQLINDTANPMSAIRGHSLLRDMYGNDALFNGALAIHPSTGGGLQFTGVAQVPSSSTTVINGVSVAGLYMCVTNIAAADPTFFGFNFTRWILRFPPTMVGTTYVVGTTYEILADVNDSGQRVFYLPPPDVLTSNPAVANYVTPDSAATNSGLNGLPTNTSFTLDGRYLRAFNGPGMDGMGVDNVVGFNMPMSRYANFRVNGNLLLNNGLPGCAYGDPNNPTVCGMDEDYDACDLENWFLALQSADGQVMIPSFHRPSILVYDPTVPDPLTGATGLDDWTSLSATSAAKILRPRAVDHNNNITSFPDLKPGSNGRITYDVDNDGDGINDSVWLDLGYAPKRNNEGQLYKPLFAFMVIGLNGRIPLNTAGNLQLRDADYGIPLYDHASHLGNSPSEIDPTFALQAPNQFDYSQWDNAGLPVNLTQLRNLLTGTRAQTTTIIPQSSVSSGIYVPPTQDNSDSNIVAFGLDGNGNQQSYALPNNVRDTSDAAPTGSPGLRITPDTAGRWGESDYVPTSLPLHTGFPTTYPQTYYQLNNFNNLIRAGLSLGNLLTGGAPASYYDTTDDNSNTTDIFPDIFRGESADYYDSSGLPALPVERIRRFVNPIDTSGDGLVTTFGASPYANNSIGPDNIGRVSYFKYFRPAGVPVATPYTPTGVPVPPSIPDKTNNPYNGYESRRNPPNGGSPTAQLLAAMPYNNPNWSGGTIAPTPPTTIPTFTFPISTGGYFPYQDTSTTPPTYYGTNSPALDEADEMNLYQPGPFDAPFGPSDLEWLYRQQDIDGASLVSRLANLAPISFTNPVDGLRRRRLFALDTWETTNFVWANDNPKNNLSPISVSDFTSNSTFTPKASASMMLAKQITPSLAHRDRKVNLNYPLPVSNSPIEPVRQKWIRESYQLLKAVLPPKSVDTPEELAALSQFLVNIIDFRDPDGTITVFVNTDIQVTQATSTTPSTLALTTSGSTLPYLTQYGMENCPVAINEVLSYQFQRKGGTTAAPVPTDTKRMWVELINTLTQDGGADGTASDLDMTGWDFVIMQDDGLGRPDPFTGQIPAQPNPTNIKPVLLAQSNTATANAAPATAPPLPPSLGSSSPSPMITALPASSGARTNQYYVFGIKAPNQEGIQATPPVSSEQNSPTISGTLDLITNTLMQTANPGQYYWLYLRRPLNPFDMTYDPANPNVNRVVVDSFRFIFNKSQATISVSSSAPKLPDMVNPVPSVTNDYLYSLQRLQPFRGGHAVKPLSLGGVTFPANYCVPAYGFSEQTVPAQTVANPTFTGMGGQGANSSMETPMYLQSTGPIMQTLGLPNDTQDNAWDFFPFNDRDFTSVAELMYVPGCSPGLFTKQFVEFPPPIPGVKPQATPPDSKIPPTSTLLPQGYQFPAPPPDPKNAPQMPRVYPYLVENLFYTGQSEDVRKSWSPAYSGADFPLVTPTFGFAPIVHNATAAVPALYPLNAGNIDYKYIGGPGGAGWHKMFEFFEVPSSAYGSIGPVAQGSNYDWARQDLRPGLLNLNLIIDEEVFLGLMSESWMKTITNTPITTTIPNYPSYAQYSPLAGQTRLNAAQPPGTFMDPILVTQVDRTGAPTSIGYYFMNSAGFIAADTSAGGSTSPTNRLKAAFIDFLKLRSGGSRYIFACGTGDVNNSPWPGSAGGPISAERPYHSLSYPDIDYTVMRPANLPPSPFYPPYAIALGKYSGDPGVMNPYLFCSNDPVQPPPIPPRRLFQVPDAFGDLSLGLGAASATTVPPGYVISWSNASVPGDPNVNVLINATIDPPSLVNTNYNLAALPTVPNPNPAPAVPVPNFYLGSAADTDTRQHPYFRTEWLQRVMNLTTVRTHQYAVWITIGFFEVTREGDPSLVNSNPTLAYDQLGQELGLLSGRNVRFRSFFLLDRTRAIGLQPAEPDRLSHRRRLPPADRMIATRR